MKLNPILLAIPGFLILIALELLVARWRGRRVARLNDAINDISCGILQSTTATFYKFALLAIYVGVYELGHLFEMPLDSVGAWVAGFFAVDLAYYWAHRMSHEWNGPWAAHVVHHQSEEYNLSVALRQGALQPLFTFWVSLPLALVGFPPVMVLAHSAANTLYQFWIHTRLIGKLGPLEAVLNTPSHHRVHHARNPKYLDKNYAGVLIIWDRLFGTFAAEEEEPTYGVTKALNSWNPVWANLHTWTYIRELMRVESGLLAKLRVLVRPPAWVPEGMPSYERPEGDVSVYDPPLPRALGLYVLAQFSLVLAANVTVIALYDRPSGAIHGGLLAWILGSLVVLGGLMEGRRWAPLAEFTRLLVTAGAAAALLELGMLGGGLAALGGLASAGLWVVLLVRERSHFLVRVAPLELGAATAEYASWREAREARERLPVRRGDAASAIFTQRWGPPV